MTKCTVKGCKARASRIWPFLSPVVALCSEHSKNPPIEEWKALIRKVKSLPDDFDIPVLEVGDAGIALQFNACALLQELEGAMEPVPSAGEAGERG